MYSVSLDHRVQLLEHLVMFGKASGLVLAVNQFPVSFYIENAPAADNHLNFTFKLIFDRFRQTGGFRQIVSLLAVFNTDFHAFSPQFFVRRRSQFYSYIV